MRRASFVSLVTLVIVTVLASGAVAVLPNGNFEGSDGNMVVDAQGHTDWESFIGHVAIGQDQPSGATDNSLGQGSKDDNSTFTVTTGSIPSNKDDLDRFYVATDNLGTFPGKDFLYLGWTRKNTLGTANESIELNQAAQSAPPAGGSWALNRTAGDLLILFDFASGGKVNKVVLSVSQWVTSGNPKTVCQANNSVPCWGKKSVLGSTVSEGAVNTAPIVDRLNNDAPLAQLTFGEAAINLTDAGLLPNLCVGFGSAMIRSRASAAFDSELKDFIAPIRVSITRTPNPDKAHARENALGAKVDDVTVLGSNPVNLPKPPGTDPSVQTSQTGAGTNGPQSASQTSPRVPTDGSILSADVIRATSLSSIGSMGASHTSTAETLNLNILNGTVTADVVLGMANTEASNLASDYSTAGSSFKNLKIQGQTQNDVTPNSRVGLPALTFGSGSYVALYELGPGTDPNIPGSGFGTTSQPPVGQAGTFAADVTVTMIRVHITDDNGALPGGNPAEIIVSRVKAHSDFQGIRCTNREVSGHAYIAQENTTPPVVPALLGYVSIPRSGGEQLQHFDNVTLGGGSALTANNADSDSLGDVSGNQSEATSYAQVHNLCLLPTATGCTISATVLKAASHSKADGTVAASDPADTQFLNLVVADNPIAENPPPNTIVSLNVGFVVLNEQFCDGAGVLPSCASGNHAGLTVRAIHLVINVPNNPLGLAAGTEIIVCEAHSDATFVS